VSYEDPWTRSAGLVVERSERARGGAGLRDRVGARAKALAAFSAAELEDGKAAQGGAVVTGHLRRESSYREVAQERLRRSDSRGGCDLKWPRAVSHGPMHYRRQFIGQSPIPTFVMKGIAVRPETLATTA
jgi:hypothetical protein